MDESFISQIRIVAIPRDQVAAFGEANPKSLSAQAAEQFLASLVHAHPKGEAECIQLVEALRQMEAAHPECEVYCIHSRGWWG